MTEVMVRITLVVQGQVTIYDKIYITEIEANLDLQQNTITPPSLAITQSKKWMGVVKP